MFDNQIQIGEKVFELKPIKMKYIKDNFYGYYMLIKQHGIMKILNYKDGKDVINKFFIAIFDNNIDDINYIHDEIDAVTMKELLKKVKEINEIEDEEDLKNV